MRERCAIILFLQRRPSDETDNYYPDCIDIACCLRAWANSGTSIAHVNSNSNSANGNTNTANVHTVAYSNGNSAFNINAHADAKTYTDSYPDACTRIH
jgi:uncharacterized protein YkuJ